MPPSPVQVLTIRPVMANATSSDSGQRQLAVVIGANKGVGLAVALRLQQHSFDVVAACRTSTPELDSAASLQIVTDVDVTQDPATAQLQRALGGRHVDLLVISAGFQQIDNASNVTRQGIREHVEVNALGPLFAALELRSLLRKGSKVVFISSRMASITEAEKTGGKMFGYRMGKCALNMAGKTLALELKGDGIPVALMHPGVVGGVSAARSPCTARKPALHMQVNTLMLRNLRKAKGLPESEWSAGSIEPEASADGIWSLIEQLSLENTGSYWAADSGQLIGW